MMRHCLLTGALVIGLALPSGGLRADDPAATSQERLEQAVRAGVPEERVVLDPGLGFAKTADQNLEILARLPEYAGLGRPILVGASRKSFLSRYSGTERTEDRLEATLAVTVLAMVGGASVLRVHDVAANRKAVLATEAVLGAARETGS